MEGLWNFRNLSLNVNLILQRNLSNLKIPILIKLDRNVEHVELLWEITFCLKFR